MILMTLAPLAAGNSSWRRLAWALVAVRFLTGAGEAASYPNANKIIGNWMAAGQRGIGSSLLLAGGWCRRSTCTYRLRWNDTTVKQAVREWTRLFSRKFARNWKTPLDWKIIAGSRRKQLRTERRNTQLTSAARLSAILACVISLLAPIRAKAQLPGQNRPAPRRDSVQHVLLISIDEMHSIDLANLVKDRPDSALAKLSRHAVTYSNASTSFPSNSWPGLLSMVSGGSPNVTGVIFENSYDRSLSPPASDCSRIGTPIIFDSSIDKNRDAVDGGGGIDPDKLPRDPKKGCTPVFPHRFIRVNTIFEIVKRSGGRTAWSDKHPAYDFVNGPSGTGVDDLFTPEVRSSRGLKNTESYDDLKVAAILNEINGKDHTGTREVGVPAIFGMNFQEISVAKKTAGGVYLDGSGRLSPPLV